PQLSPVCAPRTVLVFLTHTLSTQIFTLSLHDALPISGAGHAEQHLHAVAALDAFDQFADRCRLVALRIEIRLDLEANAALGLLRSEEHTSELQSLTNVVCRLLLAKKHHLNITDRIISR